MGRMKKKKKLKKILLKKVKRLTEGGSIDGIKGENTILEEMNENLITSEEFIKDFIASEYSLTWEEIKFGKLKVRQIQHRRESLTGEF